MVYSVIITDRAKADLQGILEDDSRYAPAARLAYFENIETCCNLLEEMPERFPQHVVNDIQYRSFPFKGHRIYYEIRQRTVFIIAVLHRKQLAEKHL